MIPLGSRLLLYLSAAGASCALQRNGQLSEVQYLPGEEEGWEAFNARLMAHPDTPVAIAVGAPDSFNFLSRCKLHSMGVMRST